MTTFLSSFSHTMLTGTVRYGIFAINRIQNYLDQNFFVLCKIGAATATVLHTFVSNQPKFSIKFGQKYKWLNIYSRHYHAYLFCLYNNNQWLNNFCIFKFSVTCWIELQRIVQIKARYGHVVKRAKLQYTCDAKCFQLNSLLFKFFFHLVICFSDSHLALGI